VPKIVLPQPADLCHGKQQFKIGQLFGKRNAIAWVEESMKKKIALLILLLLQAGDMVSTKAAVHAGAVELNPLVRDLGLWPAKLLTLGLIALLVWRARSMTRVWVVCGLYTLVVANNLFFALK
jgi:hypothetical protein